MNTGIVKISNDTKGLGFIQPVDGSSHFFVHVSALERAGIDNMRQGQKLEFDLEPDSKGRHSAGNLRLL